MKQLKNTIKDKNVAAEGYGIRLHGIEYISSSLNQKPTNFTENKDFVFNINIENKIDLDKKIVVSFVKVEITQADLNITLASLNIGVGIQIMDFEKVMYNLNNELYIPPRLNVLIQTISLSTLRGVVFSELRGTYLHGAFMPIILTQIPEEDK